MMKIGIMGAMPEEIETLHHHMTDVTIIERGCRKYHVGKMNHYDVVLVFSRWGKVAAATTATSLITEFQIEELIFIGVAGAAGKALNMGDIVISEKLFQHDMDARPLMTRHQIPLTDITFFKADVHLIERARMAVERLLEVISEKITPSALKKFNISNPKWLIGTIATGDQFIHDRKQSDAIIAEVPETAAIEMEGAAVAQVCYDYNIPFVAIRTISDKADHDAPIDFPSFVNEVAKYYSGFIIHAMLCA